MQALARGKAKAEQGKTKAERELEAIKEQIRLMVTQRYGRRSLAYTLVSKFQDSFPLHRQSTILSRHEVDIPRHTLARWHIKASEKIEPLIERFEAAMQASPVILIDETRLQVNKEPGKDASSQSYMWVRRGVSPPGHPDDQQ